MIVEILEIILMVLFTSGFFLYSKKRIDENKKVTWLGLNTITILIGSAILYYFLLSTPWIVYYNKLVFIIIIPYLMSELFAVLVTYTIPHALENVIIRLLVLVTGSLYIFLATPPSSYRFIVLALIILFWIYKSKGIYNALREVHMIRNIRYLKKIVKKFFMNIYGGLMYILVGIKMIFSFKRKQD